MTLTILPDVTVLQENNSLNSWRGLKHSTATFWGNALAMLQDHFPAEQYDRPDYVADNIKDAFIGQKEATKIWGMDEYGLALYTMHCFINGRDCIQPTLKEIDQLRIDNNMTINYLPAGSSMDEVGMRFQRLQSVTQVMIAMLYFYAYYDYKLCRCIHCGKWFATKTLKSQYCPRTSPCWGNIVKGKKALTCEQATQNIRQNCKRLRKNIDAKAAAVSPATIYDSNDFRVTFYQACQPLYEQAKEHPTVENLTEYYNFLQATNKAREWLKGDTTNGKT
jgi:hypothetical protein